MPTNLRNDGTDLWKSTLSGQPPAAKPQQNANAWSHTPQNPTDYKNWGEDDENSGSGGHNGPIGSQATGGQNAGSNAHMPGGPGFGPGPGAPGRNDTNFWGSDGPNGPQYNGK